MWPDAADEVFAADQALALAYVTPAGGVVLTPVTNFGVRDRVTGTLETVNSSLGMWKKLERITRNPKIALAYHTREHSTTQRPEHVLVQGDASLTSLADRGEYLDSMADAWERFGGRPHRLGPLRDRWLRVYHWRAGIRVGVRRVLIRPGSGPPEPAAPQDPPAKGTGPRLDHARAARRAAVLPNVLLGWTGADGYPVVVAVGIGAVSSAGIALDPPSGWLPPGGRRAGLLAHSFTRHVVGQHKRSHTGWLEVGEDGAVYAPHTESGYRLPAWQAAYDLGAGAVTRRGFRAGRRAGFLPS